MLGDVLKREIYRLKYASLKKVGQDAFWVILREIAVKEIIEYNSPIDSDTIIPLYYDIVCDNLDSIPQYFQEILPSNKQERFRVIIRNLFSSNAFHPDGLANQDGIYAYKEINEFKKGERIVYQKA
ncbi:MAG: hypothetical protein K6G48_01180 [Acholeplasmatales bacterium]|nr:hypothetical protein [Acholeplasmatales bacterium]